VDILLWIIGEGRWKPQNFPSTTMDDAQLLWDATQSISNYETLATSLMAQQNGTSWLTESASAIAASPYASPAYGANPSLRQAYYAFCGGAAPGNGSTVVPPTPCSHTNELDASVDAADDAGEAGDGGEAVDASQDAEGGVDAGDRADAGNDSASEASTPPPPATGCDAFDDLDVALSGIDPSSVWLTRLRGSLPASALATDLVLAAGEQTPVSNVHSARQAPTPTTATSSGNGGSGGGCASGAHREAFGSLTLLGLTAASVATMLRRRRR
jgi:hypothetical protein